MKCKHGIKEKGFIVTSRADTLSSLLEKAYLLFLTLTNLFWIKKSFKNRRIKNKPFLVDFCLMKSAFSNNRRSKIEEVNHMKLSQSEILTCHDSYFLHLTAFNPWLCHNSRSSRLIKSSISIYTWWQFTQTKSVAWI